MSKIDFSKKTFRDRIPRMTSSENIWIDRSIYIIYLYIYTSIPIFIYISIWIEIYRYIELERIYKMIYKLYI